MKLPRLGLYARFFVLFSLTTLFLALCVAIGVANIPEDEAKEFIKERHEKLHDMMITSIEDPLPLQQIKDRIKAPKIEIFVLRGEQRISTTDNFPSFDSLKQEAEPIGQLLLAKKGYKYYLLAESENGQIAVTSGLVNLLVYPGWFIWWPALAAFIVLTISYLILKRLLRPVASATHCAKMVSEGNFDYQISHHSKTELADLTLGLNKMTRKLKELFESKNDLLLAISHELRTPLARMNISLAMIGDSQLKQDLKKDIKQVDELVEQLLEGERLQHGHEILHLSTQYVPSLITEILIEPEMGERVTLKGAVPEEALNIDEGRIKFLLRNLIRNAINHSSDTTTVSVSVQQHEEFLHFVITDQGSGIPSDAIEHIFEPFYCVENTTHRDTKGTGLGLFLSQRIATAHKGKLSVTSEEGKGTTFTLALPLIAN